MKRIVKIRHYVDVMVSMGHPAAAVLEGSGIAVADLSQPDFISELHQCKKVVANMMRLSGNQAIGFEVGSRMRMVDLGILAHAVMSARTPMHVVDLWMRYGRTIADMLIRFDLAVESEDNWRFAIVETAPLGFLYNFCVEEALTMVQKFGASLMGEPLSFRRISLTYPAPSHEALYRRYFACPIEFNAEKTSITFGTPPLHQPLKTNDDELNEVCEARCQQIMRQIASDSPTGTRLRGLLLKNASPFPALGESAVLMGMSPRNLRRQLAQEGTTYRDIVNELRIELAKEYLRSGEFLPKEVSYLLGFKDPNAFRRAFKSWTGQTVSDYRARPVGVP